MRDDRYGRRRGTRDIAGRIVYANNIRDTVAAGMLKATETDIDKAKEKPH